MKIILAIVLVVTLSTIASFTLVEEESNSATTDGQGYVVPEIKDPDELVEVFPIYGADTTCVDKWVETRTTTDFQFEVIRVTENAITQIPIAGFLQIRQVSDTPMFAVNKQISDFLYSPCNPREFSVLNPTSPNFAKELSERTNQDNSKIIYFDSEEQKLYVGVYDVAYGASFVVGEGQ